MVLVRMKGLSCGEALGRAGPQHAPGTWGPRLSRGRRWSLKNCDYAETQLHVGFSDNSQPYFRFLQSVIKAVIVNY